MMNFILIVLAIMTANIISIALSMLAFSSEKIRKWWTKQCLKMFDDVEEQA